ncbi:MAG: hypothetical protein HRU15_02795 [Planctomycetes bacterium]|nr:hypothetical protein [Planctomycetota bacterium]
MNNYLIFYYSFNWENFFHAPDLCVFSYSWFPYPGINGPQDDYEGLQKAIGSSREQILETIDHIQSQIKFDSDKLILMGFSQGCVMMMDLALRRPIQKLNSGSIVVIQCFP